LIALTMSALSGGQGGAALAELFQGNDDSEPDDEDYDPTKHTEEEAEDDHVLSDEDRMPEEAPSPEKLAEKNMDTVEEPTPKEQEVKAVIFRVVQALGAYMPSPVDDLGWFKRVLKHVTSSQTSGEMTWYNWGCPPIAPLVTCLKSEDPNLVKHASVIISLFQAQQQSQPQDNVGSEEDVDDADFIPT